MRRPPEFRIRPLQIPETDQEPPRSLMGPPPPRPPEIGRLYRIVDSRRGTAYIGIHLPLGSLEEVGITGEVSVGRTKIPECYKCVGDQIIRWAEGYEDGGRYEVKRKYPVLYLDDKLKVPLKGEFRLPKRLVRRWLEAAFFQPFDRDDELCKTAIGYVAASKYMARMIAMTPGSSLNPTHTGNDGTSTAGRFGSTGHSYLVLTTVIRS